MSIGLAQISQASTPHGCGYAHDRTKEGPENFYSKVNSDQTYDDLSFPTDDAIYWEDDGEEERTGGPAQIHKGGQINWTRVSSSLMDEHTLFGEQLTPDDILQGQIGNCWWMAALSALAEYPGRVENLFLNRQLSEAGVYGVNLYALNVPVTIQVDDWLPLRSNGSDAIFAKIPEDGSLWGPIIEKAFAKFHGNYARLEQGWVADGVNTLNGSPSFDIDNGGASLEKIWQAL